MMIRSLGNICFVESRARLFATASVIEYPDSKKLVPLKGHPGCPL